MEKLALHGGEPFLESPVDPLSLRPLRFGQQEKDALFRFKPYLPKFRA